VAGLALALTLAACGGGGGAGGAAVGVASTDPAGTVNALVATIQAKAFDKLPDLACAASKSSITGQFDPTSALAGAGALGVTGADFLAAISIEMSNVVLGTPQTSGDTSTVHMKADMKITADQTKLKDLVTKMLTAAGQAPTDAMVNTAMAAAGTAFSQTRPWTKDITLKNEGGKWLVCGV